MAYFRLWDNDGKPYKKESAQIVYQIFILTFYGIIPIYVMSAVTAQM